jgi:hypothetical protein
MHLYRINDTEYTEVVTGLIVPVMDLGGIACRTFSTSGAWSGFTAQDGRVSFSIFRFTYLEVCLTIPRPPHYSTCSGRALACTPRLSSHLQRSHNRPPLAETKCHGCLPGFVFALWSHWKWCYSIPRAGLVEASR